MRIAIALAALLAIPAIAHAADLLTNQPPSSAQARHFPPPPPLPTYHGQARVLDGRTLFFPYSGGATVRLARLDACNLPQWSFEKTGYPYPCGPFAKAWLKRLIGHEEVTCKGQGYDRDGQLLAYCSVAGHDIGANILRVGLAMKRNKDPDCCYSRLENYAKSARYGMWDTYVLDPEEWRRKAVDRTLQRQPIADSNLIYERESSISPPFFDPIPTTRSR